MKKLTRRLRQLLCYLLVLSVTITLLTPAVTVNAATKKVALNLEKATILVGDKTKLSLDGGEITKIKSMNKKIATVKKDGTVTGKKAGKTKIIVTGSNGKNYTCKVTVKIGLTKTKAYITQGGSSTIELKGTAISKVSVNKKTIASAKKKGTNKVVITAKSKGTVKVKIKGKNRKTYVCKVTVEQPKLDQTDITLAKGDKTTVTMSGTKQEITWDVQSDRLASINPKGQITGVAKGNTAVTACDESGMKYTCLVKVEEPKMAASELNMIAGNDVNLYLADNTQKVTWSSDKPDVVSVDANGKATTKSDGIATITAKVASGAVFTMKITVSGSSTSDKKDTTDNKDNTGDKDNTDNKDNTSDKDNTEGKDNTGDKDNTEGKDNTGDKDNTEGKDNTGDKDNTEGKDNTGDKDNTEGKDNTGDKDNTDNSSDTSGKDEGITPGVGDRSDGTGTGRRYTPEEEDESANESGSGSEEQGSEEPDKEDNKDKGEDAGEDDPATAPTVNPDAESDSDAIEEDFYVNFMDPEGGSSLKPIIVSKGTRIDSLPVPEYGSGRVFEGWYYDAEYTNPANGTDVVTKTIILYAKSSEMMIKTPEEVVKVTAIEDAGTDFTIKLHSTVDKTPKEILGTIDFVNVTHKGSPEYQLKENNIEITGSKKDFTIKGKHLLFSNVEDGFEKGASYVIKLPDLDSGSNDVISFDGQPNSVREYDISIAQEEVNNMALADSVVTIALSELEGIYDDNGKDNSKIVNRTYYDMDAQGNTTEAEEVSGYFVLKGDKADEIEVGSTIALFTGLDPQKAMEDPEKYDADERNHITYLFVNKIDGNKFYYGNAELTDIIKMPEVLPVRADADLELDENENTLEIFKSELDWSDDMYSSVRLDSTTTLDEGDFIVLYKGQYGSADMEQAGSYLQVVSVEDGGTTKNPVGDDCEYVIVTVKKASLTDIAESGDTSYKRPVDAMEYLTDDQIKELEEQTKEDAKTSGFLEEAGKYLAKTAMATEGFTTLDGVEKIEGLEDYNYVIKDADGNPIDTAHEQYNTYKQKYKEYSKKYSDMMETYKQFADAGEEDDDGSVEVKLEDLDADISRGEHLDGGLGVTLSVVFSVEITVPKFEKELGGDDDDKKDGDDKKDDDKKEESDDKKDDDKKDDDKKDDDKKDEVEDEPDDENKLNIEISAEFTQEIQLSMGFDAKIEWKEILCVPYPADVIFMPSFTTGTYTGINVNAVVTTGTDDGYGDAILDDYKTVATDISEELKSLMEADAVEDDEDSEEISNWMAVKYKEMLDTEHDAITLVEIKLFEQKFEIFPGILQFGVELKFQVTVDVVISLGMEFYNIQKKKTIYSIHVLQMKCTSETIELIPSELDFKFYVMGFLEIKVGFELELSLNLVEGMLGKASLTVGVGAYLDMYGFFYYHVNIRKGVKTENAAGALYFELGIYVEIGVGAQLGRNYKKLKGKIASFETTLFEAQFPLKSWGEEEVPLNFKILQDDIDDFEMHQYVTKFVIPDEYYEVTTMSMTEGEIGSTTYEDKCYGVEFSNKAFTYDPETHTVSLADGYTEMEAECTATLYYKNGYVPLSYARMERTIEISWDNYLDGYAITPFSEGGSYVPAITGKFGAEIKKPKNPTRKGYVFDGWYEKVDNADGTVTEKEYTFPETMPAESVRIYAHWTPATNTPYTVRYYLENPELAGEYIYDDKQVLRGTTGELGTLSTIPKPGEYRDKEKVSKFMSDAEFAEKYNKYVYSDKSDQSVEIRPDGSAELHVYYNLKRSTYTFKRNEDDETPIELTAKYSQNIYAPEISKSGYQIKAWKKITDAESGAGTEISIDDIKKAGQGKEPGSVGVADGENATFVAQWEPKDVLYRVEYYVQQLSGEFSVQAVAYGKGKPGTVISAEDLRKLVVTTVKRNSDGTETTERAMADTLFSYQDGLVPVLEYDCMTVDGAKQEVTKDNGEKIEGTTIGADESTVIKVRYKRTQFTITLAGKDANDVNGVYTDYKVCAGGKMALPIPVKEGYTFLGYENENGEQIVPREDTGFAVIENVMADATYTSRGFEPNTYKVNYDTKGGTMPLTSQDFLYGTAQNLYAAPTYPGYQFIGWKDELTGKTYQAEESVNNLTSKDKEVVHLVALWKLQGYEVTYDTVGGTIAEDANPSEYIPGASETPLAYPVKEGYTFDGWYNGTEKVVSLPSGHNTALELKAKWTAKQTIPYTVNHYQMNADGLGKTLVLSESLTGTMGETMEPAVKSFDGFTSPAVTDVVLEADGSTVVNYDYTRNSHKLTLDFHGGHNGEDVDAKDYDFVYGADIHIVPEMENAVFTGWMLDEQPYTGTMPDSDLTLVAAWAEAAEIVTVEHYKQDVTGNGYELADREIVSVEEGETYTPVAKSYDGFTASEPEWSEDQKTVKFNYTRAKHKVTWELNGGEAINDYTDGEVYYGQAIVAPVLKQRNYSYTWNASPAGVMGDADLSYTANWTADVHKVAFDPMGGAIDGDLEKEVTCDETYGELPTPEKDYAEFTGWYDAKENGNKVDENTVVKAGKDHILYAGWKYQEIPITYHGVAFENETVTNENPAVHRVGEDMEIKAPVREGYLFTGWTVGDSTDKVMSYVIAKNATDPVTLTANWELRAYTLTLYSYSGLYLVKEYQKGADLSKISNPSISGYELTGWKNLQNDTMLDKIPGEMPASDLTLVSQWKVAKYTLTTEGATITINGNQGKTGIVNWTMEDDSFLIPDPDPKTGYEFGGWYPDNRFDPSTSIDRMEPVAMPVTVYAKWIPKKYKINLYFNNGVSALEGYTDKQFYDADDCLFTYDETKSLKTASELKLTRNGYTFMGWSTTGGSDTVAYKDGYQFAQNGHSLYNGEQIRELYAVWSKDKYTITYDSVNVGAAKNPSANVTEYYVDTSNLTLNDPEDIKPGYEFTGWEVISGDGSRLNGKTLKLLGYTGNLKLRATWAYVGTFSLSIKGTPVATPADDGSTSTTYTVTRTIPSGITVSDVPQRVYFRTVNGTAVGGTVEVKGSGEGAPEKDIYSANNFKHVGGNGVYALFEGKDDQGNLKKPKYVKNGTETEGTVNSGNGMATVDFSVEKERASIRYYGEEMPGLINGTFAHQYNYTGTNTRYYTVELYRIESATGSVTGVYGNREVTRTMTMPSDKVLTVEGMYGNKTLVVDDPWNTKFHNDSSYSDAKGPIEFGDMLGLEKSYYLKQAGVTGLNMKIRVNADSDEAGQTWSNQYRMKYNIVGTDTWFERGYGGWIDEDKGYQWCDIASKDITWDDFAKGKVNYYGMTKDKGAGSKTTKFWIGKHEFTISYADKDNEGPDQVGIAPAATTDYQKGDKVRFSVVFDEVIVSASDVTVNPSVFREYMPLEEGTGKITYKGGAGTNVLVFEGIAAKNFKNTTKESTGTNKELMKIKPVNGGTVKDMKNKLSIWP